MSEEEEFGTDEKEKVKIILEKRIEGHSDYVNSILCIGPPRNLLVSCSDDNLVLVSNFEGKVLATLSDHDQDVISLGRFNSDIFFSSSFDGTIRFYTISIAPEQVKVIKLEMNRGNSDTPRASLYYTERIIGSAGDILVSIVGNSHLDVVSYVGRRTLYSITTETPGLNFTISASYTSFLRKSFIFPNSVYFKGTQLKDAGDSKESIPLIDVVEKRVLMTFNTREKTIFSAAVFLSQPFEEQVIFGAVVHEYFLYRVTKEMCLPKACLKEEGRVEISPTKIIMSSANLSKGDRYFSDIVRSLCVIDKRYLVSGDTTGVIHIFDISQLPNTETCESSGIKCGEERCFTKKILDMKVASIQPPSVHLAACSADSSVRLFKVTGLQIREQESRRFEKQDLGESEDDEEEGKENKDEPPLKKIKKE